MLKQTITIEVDQSGNITHNRKLVRIALDYFKGRKAILTLQEWKRPRSNQQNRYLWGVIYPLMQIGFKETFGENYSKNEVHEWCKLKFNYREIHNEETGEFIHVPKSTTTNDTFDQEEYHEQIRRFAFEWFNITIPLPNENLTLEL